MIRIRLSGHLICSGCLLLIDGRQPIGFVKDCLNQSSIPLRSQISEPCDRSEARRSFADVLCALQKVATQHQGGRTAQKRVQIMLFRLYKNEILEYNDNGSYYTEKPEQYQLEKNKKNARNGKRL